MNCPYCGLETQFMSQHIPDKHGDVFYARWQKWATLMMSHRRDKPTLIQQLMILHGKACLCCRSRDRRLTVDHIVPMIAGGASDIWNLQPLCEICNKTKNQQFIDYRWSTATQETMGLLFE